MAQGTWSVGGDCVALLGFIVVSLWRFFQDWAGEAQQGDWVQTVAQKMRRGLMATCRSAQGKAGHIELPIHAAASLNGELNFVTAPSAWSGPTFRSWLEAQTVNKLFTLHKGQGRLGQECASSSGAAVSTSSADTVSFAALQQHWALTEHVILPTVFAHKTWGPLGEIWVRGQWPMDVVMVREGCRRNRHRLPQMPPRNLMSAYFKSCPGNASGLHPSVTVEPVLEHAPERCRHVRQLQGCIVGYAAEHLIACVRATRHLRAASDLPDTVQDIAEVLPTSVSEQLRAAVANPSFRFPSRWTLERARVKLDLASMLARRTQLQMPEKRARALYFDASSVSGVEIMVCVEETVVNLDTARAEERLMPLSALGHGHMGVIDKTMRICKAIFLEAGPSKSAVHKYLQEVRILGSDDGAEHYIEASADVMDFFLDGNLDPSPEELDTVAGQYLFPVGMRTLPWNHIWANIVKRVLLNLLFFPGLLTQLRKVCNFLRTKSYRRVLIACLREQGETELAKSLKSFKASFAKWRWETAFAVSSALMQVSTAVQRAFDPNKFHMDKVELQTVSEAVQDTAFWVKTSAVAALGQHTEETRAWGRQCSCHPGEALAAARKGQVFTCPNNLKSRRGAELKNKLDEVLTDWRDKYVNMPPSWHEYGIAGAMSSAYMQMASEAALKFDVVHRWPHIVWRLKDPDVCSRALALYDKECETADGNVRMHRVGHHFCKPGSGLRPLMQDHAAKAGLAPALEAEIDAYLIARLDETVQEAPHAGVSKAIRHALASELPWWSATERLNQNLALYNSFVDAGKGPLFHKMFNNCRAILQPKPDKARRLVPVHSALTTVVEKVYDSGLSSMVDWKALKGMYGTSKPINAHAIQSEFQWIQAELLEAIFVPGAVYVLPEAGGQIAASEFEPGPSGETFLGHASNSSSSQLAITVSRSVPKQECIVFEVLDRKPHHKVLQYSFDLRGMLVPMTVQFYHVWRPPLDIKHSEELTIFPAGGPEIADLFVLTGNCRQVPAWTQWQKTLSDTSGCLHLSGKAPATTREWDLLSLGYPCYMMLLQLKDAGWTLVGPERAGQEEHTEDAPKIFSIHGISQRKSYLRCLCMFSALQAKGLKSLPKNAHEVYYRAVLCADSPGNVNHKGPDKALRQAIADAGDIVHGRLPGLAEHSWHCAGDADDEGDDDMFAGVPAPALELPQPGPARQEAINDDGAKSNESRARTSSISSSSPTISTSTSDAESQCHSSDEGVRGASSVAPAALDSQRRARLAPRMIDWQPARVDFHAPRGYCRLGVRCPEPSHHAGPKRECYKWRNIGETQSMGLEGIAGPVAYLRCWLRAAPSFTDRASHIALKPTIEDMLAVSTLEA